MATTKDIKNRIKSVKDTQKITNAMFLIASTKLRKAKSELDFTRPYFSMLQGEIKRIFRTVKEVENKYFYPVSGEREFPGSYGYLVITADKGLAGAYNQNVIKEAIRLMSEHENPKLFVVGEYGRHYFTAHNIPIEQSFLYTAQNPTISRARVISNLLLDLFNRRELAKIYIIYTDMQNAVNSQACSTRLLPFHRTQFIVPGTYEKEVKRPFEFVPSVEEVLDNIVPSYVTGFIYSALIDSFCSEQNARMTAMDAANKNAQKLLDELSVQYNHIRQSAITQEITEVSSGAKSMRKKTKGLQGGAKV
ncbi:MAG TPA: ATP synthase F1 subunit gamma [Candidatus Avimonoglobus intestinipullorum]|uniref:ATP synthase gamma chain n=1 Tax=Candidatus Avimonoglobus intestinipullorum TaxID=2840699 RepID=A0A9D1S6Z5_9FIRM|nr:ATP synthase F1 subunit gamma [Candidatus Avimonoglobus intestinipullorum]